MEDRVVASVIELAEKWRLAVSEEAARRVARFFELLLFWNRRLNLTGAADIDELLSEHLPDSFALGSICPSESDVVDVGSGGGLPAVPFAILRPDCRVTLVEPRAKRVAFLHAAQRAAGRELAVVRARADKLGHCTFSVAVSRATFRPEEWLRVAVGLLPQGGRIVALAVRRLDDLGHARLEREIEYETGSGSRRWLGSYLCGSRGASGAA